MKNPSLIINSFIVLMISYCCVSQTKYDAEKLIEAIEKTYNEGNYKQARQNIELLYSKHPESPKNAKYKELLKTIEIKEKEESKKIEVEVEAYIKRIAAETERSRQEIRSGQENINNLGIWEIYNYVDHFGAQTNKRYIQNTEHFDGTFNNSATQNSPLYVDMLINNASNISIMLYEYARDHPVKAISDDYYYVMVKDQSGNTSKLNAVNHSDRLRINETDSKKLQNILLKGGEIQFYIEGEYHSQYNFTIKNADWYGNAYKKLTQNK
jgi:hypothetical protein